MRLFVPLFVLMSSVLPVAAQNIFIPKFDLQGHRGARGLLPENTIEGFLVALDSGVTTLELDVVITADRQVVLSHEPWMSATICTGSDGSPVSEQHERSHNIYRMTYDEVRQYDCGSMGHEGFPQQKKMAVSKPLLSDVIIAVENHIRSYSRYEVDYNIEIKSTPEGDNVFHPDYREFSDLVYQVLDKYLSLRRVVIQSFDFRVLQYWNKKYPRVRLSALVENQDAVTTNLTRLGFKPSVYSPHFSVVDRNMIRYLRQQRIRCIPWTVNETDDMRRMLALGVDGFITDYPDRANQLGLGIKRRRR